MSCDARVTTPDQHHPARVGHLRVVGTVRGTIVTGCIAALTACATPLVDAAAPPYDPTSLTGGVLYHWQVGTGIAIHVVPGPTPGDDQLRDAASRAAGRWPEALAYREHVLRIVDAMDAADIIVRDSRIPSPVSTSCGGPGWTDGTATTFFCPLGDTARTLELLAGTPGRTKVLITVDVGAALTQGRLAAIVMHEIGHALGIGGHSPVSTDVMFSVPAVVSPSRRDARTLRYLLHRRPDLIL